MNILLDLFLTFARIGGLTFGGGYAMLPILQREVAENKKWTTEEELMDYYAIGQLMAYFISDEFPEADINKIIQMCIFHDMGEAFTGDIPAFNKTDEHEKIESEMLYSWINTLPSPFNKKVKELFMEMDEQKTS